MTTFAFKVTMEGPAGSVETALMNRGSPGPLLLEASDAMAAYELVRPALEDMRQNQLGLRIIGIQVKGD